MPFDDKTSLERYAKKILPEEQIRKFKYRQDLLKKELENEANFPEVKNVLSDIFVAVKEKNFKKFLISHKFLKNRIDEETLRLSIWYNIVSKKTALSHRESDVLEKLMQGKSLMEVF